MEVTNASANAIFGLINGTHQFSGKEFHSITVGDAVWFRAKDITNILGYGNSSSAMAYNVDAEDQVFFRDLLRSSTAPRTSDFSHNELISKYINEPGVYSLVFKSRLPAAREFSRFVKKEVLPNLRRQVQARSIAEVERLRIEHAQELERRDQTIAELERQRLALATYVHNSTEIEKTQILYIATTFAYAAQSRFKFGGVKELSDLRKRLSEYNVGRPEGDLYFYVNIYRCAAYRSAEERLHVIVAHFKDKIDSRKEMVCMEYARLCQIVEYVVSNFSGEVEFMNEHSKQILQETVYNAPREVQPIDLTEYVHTSVATTRMDVSGWSDEQLFAALEDIMDTCADERKVDYTCAEDGPAELNIPWSAISANLKKIKGLSMTQWRDKFREWYARRGPTRLQIRGLKLS